jgi:hypothetical protein
MMVASEVVLKEMAVGDGEVSSWQWALKVVVAMIGDR